MCVHEYSHIRIDLSIFGIRIHIHIFGLGPDFNYSFPTVPKWILGYQKSETEYQFSDLNVQRSANLNGVHLSALQSSRKYKWHIQQQQLQTHSVVPGAVLS